MYNRPSVPEARVPMWAAHGVCRSGSDLDIACDCTGGGARPLNQAAASGLVGGCLMCSARRGCCESGEG